MPITIAELTTVPKPGDPITSPWAQTISNQYVIHQFTSVADRNAKWPAPPLGAMASVNGELCHYNGNRWLFPGRGVLGYATRMSSVPAGDMGVTLSNIYGHIGRLYRISGRVEYQSTVVSDLVWVTLLQDGAGILQWECTVTQVNAQLTYVWSAGPMQMTTGTHSFGLSIARAAGSGTLTSPSNNATPTTLAVEDIGSILQ